MNSIEFDPDIQEFKRTQVRSRMTFFLVVVIVLAATLAILGYITYRSRLADTRAEATKQEFRRLEAEANLKSTMRTDRPLDRAEILQRLPGEKQRRVIGIAIELYEQRPPIPYQWGGKSPRTGFDSSGYVAYVLNQAHLLENPETYWSSALRKKLKAVPLELREPGDVLFYEGGPCMFYLGGNDNLSIGSLPGGIATGDLDLYQKPVGVGRY